MDSQSKSSMAASSVRGISHVALTVRDLDRAVDFYTRSAGLTEVSRSTVDETSLLSTVHGVEFGVSTEALLRGPNGQVRLQRYSLPPPNVAPVPTQGPGITHLCYQSPSTKPAFERFKAQGASMVSRGDSMVNLSGSGVYYAYLRDRDGTMLEVEHADQPKYNTDIWIGHVAIATPDLDRAIRFYAELLGSEPFRQGEFANYTPLDVVAGLDDVALRAAWFKLENMVIEIWQYLNPKTGAAPAPPRSRQAAGYSEIAFQVGDLGSEAARLPACGAQTLSPIQETGDDRRIYARDPDGNLLSFREIAADSALSIENLHKQFDW